MKGKIEPHSFNLQMHIKYMHMKKSVLKYKTKFVSGSYTWNELNWIIPKWHSGPMPPPPPDLPQRWGVHRPAEVCNLHLTPEPQQ